MKRMKEVKSLKKQRFRKLTGLLAMTLLLLATGVLGMDANQADGASNYSGVYVIRSSNDSNMVMDVEGGVYSTQGTKVIQWNYHGDVNQQWLLTLQADGSYTIRSMLSTGYLMDVTGASLLKGAEVIQWPANGGENQQWLILENGDGTVTLKSKKSGLVLDVYGGLKTAGTKIIQWESHGGSNQKWVLESLEKAAVHTVSFESNGGSSIPSQTVNNGSLASKPADPAKTGSTFGGWYADAALTDSWDFATDKVAADMTLYAKWLTQSVTVSFNTNGGSAVSPVSAQPGTTIAAPTAPQLEGYSFFGWYADAALTDLWDFAADKVAGDMTLHAKWVPVAAVQAGLYAVRTKTSGLALDVYGGSLGNGVSIIQWTYTGNNNQIWNFEPLGDGSFRIISVKSGKVLEAVAGGSVVQNAWLGGDAQKWTIQDSGSGYCKIVSRSSGKALAMESNSTATGVLLTTAVPADADTQLFMLESHSYNPSDTVSPVQAVKGLSQGIYFIKSALNGQSLDIPSFNPRNGINVAQWTANGGLNQKMELRFMANGLYEIVPLNSAKPLTVPTGAAINGTKVYQWYDTPNNASQYWEIREGAGGYKIVHGLTGLGLDIPGGSTTPGTELILWQLNGGLNQEWTFEYVSATPNVKESVPGLAGKVIWLDPGHGRKYYNDDMTAVLFDPGAAPAGKVAEYVNNARAALELKSKLEAQGATVLITRTNTTQEAAELVPTNRTLELRSRAYSANEIKADIFISFHNNASASASVNGVSTWYYLPDAADDANYTKAEPRIAKSVKLADYVQAQLASKSGFADYGVRGADFAVIRESSMPAILMELGFITNEADYALIQNNRTAAVNAIYDGLVQYFGDSSCY